MARSTKAPAPAATPTPRRAFLAALLLSLCGLGVALWLVRLHGEAHAGKVSFCNISETINCDKVATSPYSVVLGLPVAIWGAVGYAVAAALSALGLSSRRLHPAFPSGLLLLFGAAATGAAVRLAYVSEVLIGAWCLFCVLSWTISAAVLVAAVLACRPPGLVPAVSADLKALLGRPAASGGAAVALLVLLALLLGLYPRYWDHARAAEPPRPTGATGPSGQAAPPPLPLGTRPGSAGAVVFSDYECPYCAISHDDLKQVLARRPDIRVVKRHFPLDQACNPVLKRPMHKNACEYARAAICSEAQGRFEAMDDALFELQKVKEPLDVVIARLGLDAAKLRACMASKETEARLQGDIAAAIAAGVKATPTYLLDGKEYAGKLPLEVFAPPPGEGAPPAK